MDKCKILQDLGAEIWLGFGKGSHQGRHKTWCIPYLLIGWNTQEKYYDIGVFGWALKNDLPPNREEQEKQVPQMGKQQKPKGASWHDLEGEELKDHLLLNITQVSEMHMACWAQVAPERTWVHLWVPTLHLQASASRVLVV